MTHLISPVTIRNLSWVADNVDEQFIVSAIPDVELMKLEPVIGEDLYAELLDQVTNDSLTPINITLLTYITPMLTKYVLEKTAFMLNNQIVNTGVISKDNENGASVTRTAMWRDMKQFKSDAEFYQQRLVDFMCKNNFKVYKDKQFTTSIFFNGKSNNRPNNSTKG